jgi:hypothetical protein
MNKVDTGQLSSGPNSNEHEGLRSAKIQHVYNMPAFAINDWQKPLRDERAGPLLLRRARHPDGTHLVDSESSSTARLTLKISGLPRRNVCLGEHLIRPLYVSFCLTSRDYSICVNSVFSPESAWFVTGAWSSCVSLRRDSICERAEGCFTHTVH